MPISTTEAFEKRQITRDDGVNVLSRPLITVAALEAGYSLPSPTVNEAVSHTKYPGQMTSEEFEKFCSDNKDCMISAKDMAKSVVVVAPSNVITRGSLESIIKQTSSPESALSEEEIDTLFDTLDTDNKGAITADDFMRALYGDEGVLCLHEQRHADAKEAEDRLQRIEEENARAAEEEEQKKKEAEEAARVEAENAEKAAQAEKEEKAKADAEAAAKAQADKEAESAKKKEEASKEKASDAGKGAGGAAKKQKTKSCC